MNIIYTRVSSDEQNPENQLKDCKEVCKRLNLKEPKIFTEQQSAWKNDDKREEFNKILELIKKRQVKNLIVWDLDRIYRNRKKQVAFFDLCKNFKVNIYSFRQKFLEELNNIPEPWNDIMSNMMVQVMGWMAQDESDKKSMRVKASIREKDGIKYSHQGNKWGRPSLSKKIEEQVKKLHSEGKTYPEISKQVYYWDRSNNKKFISGAKISHIIRGRKE